MSAGLASVTDNRTYIEKADMVLSDLTSNGLLQPAQAQKFMRILIEEAKLMPLTTVVPMRSPKQQIDKIRFGSRILRAGAEGVALAEGDRSSPDLGLQVELDAKLFKAEVRLTDEVLEDSIERGDLRTTIMQLMGERIAVDMEEVAVQGDTASGDTFLAQFDGILKQATSNVVNAGSVAINKTVWRDMLKSMPKEALRDKSKMKFLTAVDVEIDWRDAIADRATILGDAALVKGMPIDYSGVQILDIHQFPEAGSLANAMLLDPKNIQWGIWRKIKIETDRLVREGVLLIVVTLRMDVKFAHEPYIVRANNIAI